MLFLEVPASLERNRQGKRRLMDDNVRYMFWYGLWPETSEHDLSYYVQNLHPRLAQWILSHRCLQRMLSYMHRLNPLFMLTYIAVQCIMVHPVAMCLHYDNSKIFIDNGCAMIAWMFVFVVISCGYFQRNLFNEFLLELEQLLETLLDENDHNELNNMMNGIHKFNARLVNFFYNLVVPLMEICIFIFNALWCLPNRRQIFSGWYPYDDTASPAFEITLFVNFVLMSLCMVSGNIVVVTVISAFIYLRVCFKIISEKFKNIKSISVRAIKNGKLYKRKLQTRMNRRSVNQEERFDTVGITRMFENLALLDPLKETGIAVYMPQGQTRTGILTQGQTVAGISSQGQTVAGISSQGQDFVGLTEIAQNLTRANRNRMTLQQYTRDSRRTITSSSEEEYYTAQELESEMKYQLGRVIHLHQVLLRITKKLDDLLKYFFIAFFSMNIMAYGGMVLTLFIIDVVSLKEIVLVFIFCEFVALYLIINLLANYIADESAAVNEALYASDWLEASTSFKRSMLIVMTRANIPVAFKAPGFDPLSLNHFGGVSKQAYNLTTTIIDIIRK